MKQFLVLLAVFPIMLLFLMQTTLDQNNAIKYNAVSDVVYAARENAKQEGGFDNEALFERLSHISGIDLEKTEIETDAKGTVTRVQKDKSRGMIHYRIKVPIGNSMAGGKLFGIRDDENTYYFFVDSVTPSEYLAK